MAAGTAAEPQERVSKFKIVLAGPEQGSLSALGEALNGVQCESQRVPQGAFALDLIAGIGAVDLIVVSDPLPDMEIEAFVADLRTLSADEPSIPIAILTDEPRTHESLTDSNCRVYSRDVPLPELVEILTGRVERAQRTEARLLVRLSLRKAGKQVLRVTQSENISRTGMLLRTKEDFPEDAKAAFEISVPGEQRPIAGEARIVRKIDAKSEALRAIAIHFESFRRSDLTRFEALLHQLTPTTGRRGHSQGA